MTSDRADALLMGETMLALASDVVFLVEPATRAVVAANAGFSRVLGYANEPLGKLTLGALLVPSNVELDEIVGRLEREAEIVLGFADFRRHDGGSVTLHCRAAVTAAGGRHYCFVGRERGAIEGADANARSEALRCRILAHAAFEALGITEGGRIIDGNERFEELMKVPLSELVGHSVMDFIPAEYQSLMLERLKAGVTEPLDHELVLSDGTRIPVEAQAKTVTVDGRTLRVTALRDISQRKRMEEDVRRALRMESIGRLAGGVAHDFNNLLTVILSVVRVMTDMPRPPSDVSDLAQIEEAAKRAAELTSHLLAFARKQITEPKVVDVNAIVRGLEGLLRRLIGEHISLTSVYAEDLGAVRIDPTQVEQVIMNLAVNARDAMPQGGTLTIETSNASLGSEYAALHPEVAPGDYVRVCVSDTGLGMDAATLARIFEPFFTTKPHGRGSGLGLATCYGIVKQSGGSIWAYSEPGRGTTFKVYLPRVQAPLSVAERPAPSVAPTGTETLLLVEDDELVRRIAARILSSHGYEVIVAVDGADALARFEELGGKIHALITDVVLPKLSAKELVATLKRSKPDLKVLYTSGYTENTVVHQGVVDADVNFLAKPYLPADLTRAVRAMLDER